MNRRPTLLRGAILSFVLALGAFATGCGGGGSSSGGMTGPGPCPDADTDTFADCSGVCDSTGLTCGDCNDAAATTFPGATEICDLTDNDCDGLVDEGLAVPPSATSLSLAGDPVAGSFDLDVIVTGPFTSFFGAGFRVALPANVSLTGNNSAGSFLLNGVTTEFSAVQLGSEVAVVATRVQGSGGTFVPGVDIAGGSAPTLITLSFSATGAVDGSAFDLTAPREVQTCDNVAETCAPFGGVAWEGLPSCL